MMITGYVKEVHHERSMLRWEVGGRMKQEGEGVPNGNIGGKQTNKAES